MSLNDTLCSNHLQLKHLVEFIVFKQVFQELVVRTAFLFDFCTFLGRVLEQNFEDLFGDICVKYM